MRTVMLTGFGAFGDYHCNLSDTVAGILNGKIVGGFQIKSAIFSAQIAKYNRGRALFKNAQDLKVAGIVSLGIASDKRGFSIETATRNIISSGKYCPALSGQRINCHRPTNEKLLLDLSCWNIPAFRGTCQDAGIITEMSDDCGGFCCNHLAYQIALAQSLVVTDQQIPFIFMHIPCAKEDIPNSIEFANQGKVTMDLQTVINGLTILLSNASL